MSDVPPRIDPAAVRSAQFQGSFRKYDSKAVDQYLTALADQLVKVNNYIDELERQVAAAPRLTAAAPGPPEGPAPTPAGSRTARGDRDSSAEAPELRTLSDDEIATLVGEETAHVLATARKAAEEIRNKAEESAARMIRESTDEAATLIDTANAEGDQLRREAEDARDVAVAKAETEAQEIVERATADADRRVAEARAMADDELVRAERVRAEVDELAESIRTEAKEEGRSMLAEAKEVRSRVLEDLQRRRDLGRAQIERLVIGRDRLLEAYAVVRENVDEMTAELEHVLDEPFEHDPALEEGFVGIVTTSAQPDDLDLDVVVRDDEQPAEDPETPTATADEVADTADEVADTADEEDAETPGDSDEEESTEDGVDLDELFARMRAEREESVASAQAVLSSTEDDESSAETEPDPEVDGDGDADGDEETATAEVDAVPAEYLASGDVYEHRADVLADADKSLSRSLKRLLADEQNEVLDAIRRTESTDLAEVLPADDHHVASYAEVAATTLGEVALAAATNIDPDVSTVDVSDLTSDLGAALVEPLRRRIERAAADVDGDHEELDERLRSLYREWKVEQIGRLATDALISAYALGQMSAAPEGGSIRWLIDPATGPCPDCQDNALEGAIAIGEAFPTGDTRPQAHSGCSCMLGVEA